MPDSPVATVRLQCAALPYRWSEAGDLQILMITSRRTRRWIVPKGWPVKGCKPWQTAEIEASEEAGVSGRMAKRAMGSFHYDKLLDEDGRVVVCEVAVFPLRVERQSKAWREKDQRDARWVSKAQAVALASDAGLRNLIARFEPAVPDGSSRPGRSKASVRR